MVTASVLTVGVDWITVVYPEYDFPEYVQSTIYAAVDRLVGEGATPLHMSLYGYSGTKVGGLFFGVGNQGSIVQVSGSLADTLWTSLDAPDAKCTRLDMQVTVLLGTDAPTIALRAAEDSRRLRDTLTKKWNIRYIDGYGKGDTTYIGSMQSLSFARVYDKMRESRSPEYVNTWRYEVVFRKDYAQSIWKQLLTQGNYRNTIICTTYAYLTGRGVNPLYDTNQDDPIKPTAPERTADSRRLQWLEDTVKPLLGGLASRGLLDAAIKALAINELEQYNHSKFVPIIKKGVD
jgi:DNA relaxase NicK